MPFTVSVDNSVDLSAARRWQRALVDTAAFVFGGTMAHSTVTVDSATHLRLAISGAPNRVAPGAALSLHGRVRQHRRGAVPTTLSVPVPKGTTFVSATGGGELEQRRRAVVARFGRRRLSRTACSSR